jgi:glycosyltransferase involved in cell wall biosynthesis
MGHQSGQALKDLIDGAFFILVPSEWYENNPMTVLEAYASGKPVIGSKIGGIPEIIMHNETGFLFEPGNQEELSRLLVQAMEMDEDSYARMANQARKFAERQFSPAQHYEQLIEIYQKVLHA